MRVRVVAERKVHYVLEIVRHRRHAPSMREAIGVQRDGDAGEDREQPEACPEREPRTERDPLRNCSRALRAGEPIDDLAEQQGLGE